MVVTTDGAISRVVDVSATQGHVVPTSSPHGNSTSAISAFGDQLNTEYFQITPSGGADRCHRLSKVLGLVADELPSTCWKRLTRRRAGQFRSQADPAYRTER
jgi:hypothetical protein